MTKNIMKILKTSCSFMLRKFSGSDVEKIKRVV